jgi:NAD+ kinase
VLPVGVEMIIPSPLNLSSDRKLTLQVVQDGNEHPIIGLDNEALSTRNVKKVEI